MAEILVCPICKTALPKVAAMSRGGIAGIDCPNCGRYNLADAFHDDFVASGQLKPSELATLSYAIRRMQGNGPPPLIVQDFALSILRGTILPSATEQLADSQHEYDEGAVRGNNNRGIGVGHT